MNGNFKEGGKLQINSNSEFNGMVNRVLDCEI
jgi:hypothetical protein